MGFIDCLRRFSQIVLIIINIIVVVSLSSVLLSLQLQCIHTLTVDYWAARPIASCTQVCTLGHICTL